jgi:hypothetical protein
MQDRLRRMEPFGWQSRQISAIGGGLFRLIFTCECSQPYATRILLRCAKYNRVIEAVPSKTFPAELSDFRRIFVGNRKILLQMKF